MGIIKETTDDIEYQIKNCKNYLIDSTDKKPMSERVPYKNIQRLRKKLSKLNPLEN